MKDERDYSGKTSKRLLFGDWILRGSRNLVDVKPLLQFPTFESIRDWDYFSRVKVDHKFGGVEWPNGTDICIDWIEAQITRQRPKVFMLDLIYC